MLIFEDKIPINRTSFVARVREVASNISVNPDWLMGIMWHESKLKSSAYNPVSKSVGLIQFMPKTASSLGTSTSALRAMSNVEQLYYVEKFYLTYKKLGVSYDSPYKLFLTTFYPRALTKGFYKNKEYVFGSEENLNWAKKIGEQNKVFDLSKDGVISIREYKRYHKDLFKKYGIKTFDTRFLYAGITVLLFALIAGYYYYLKNYKQ